MHAKIAIILLGLITISSANYIRQRGYSSDVTQPESDVKLTKLDDYNYDGVHHHLTSSSGYSSAASPPARMSSSSGHTSSAIPARMSSSSGHNSGDSAPTRLSSSSGYSNSASPSRWSSSSGYSSSNSHQENERIAEEQNRNAKYDFAMAFDDGIMDSSQIRTESRDGSKVSGSYSYSDGYFKRTVQYEADENGYRVISEEAEPIGGGPQVDLVSGKADVHTQVEGVDTAYSISAHDIQSKGDGKAY